jgi:large subunit ribosomal protein L4
MIAAALRGALSDRARDGRVHVVESLVTGETPSTKAALAALAGVVADRANFLVVLERSDAVTWLSLRNAHEVHIVAVDQVNTYDELATDDIVFTRGAYDAFVSGTGAAGARPATVLDTSASDPRLEVEPAVETEVGPPVETNEVEAVDAPDAKPELPKGAKAPLKSGGAPKGYEVKGNADSGLYHEPDGQWYDATVAEFYFKTAEDAEAAGLTRAGGPADDPAEDPADDREADK